MLYGFSGVILQGALVTLELAISSVVLAVIIGLIGAGGKLSQNRLSGLIFEGYTTLIRGVPDLVLMLLIFYGLQIALNTVTEAMGVGQIDIDPMVAGIITLGFIYGAYFTETFRGAFMAVPKGHIEAATAFGFTRGQVFRRIMFPAMMRYALPGIGNNWQVILKSTALVSLLGLEDVVKATQLAGKSTWEPFYFAIVCGVICGVVINSGRSPNNQYRPVSLDWCGMWEISPILDRFEENAQKCFFLRFFLGEFAQIMQPT